MGKEKRRAPRLNTTLPVTLVFRDVELDQIVGEPIIGSINDMSTYGLRITVPRIRVGKFHIFYSFNDNTKMAINLEVVDPDKAVKLIIPAHPIWFDHILSEQNRPFQLGLEFLVAANDSEVLQLQDLVSRNQKREVAGWFKRLFSLGG